jgi:hypothetical protein
MLGVSISFLLRVRGSPEPHGHAGTHVVAGADLHQPFTSSLKPGAYGQEIFLVMKEFEPSFSRGGDMAMDILAPAKSVMERGRARDRDVSPVPFGGTCDGRDRHTQGAPNKSPYRGYFLTY